MTLPTPEPTLSPTADRLLVWLNPGKQSTASGLIIPPSAQQITQHGRVLAIGPDVQHVAVDDTVLVTLHAGTHVRWQQNTPVLLVHETDLLAILTDLNDE